MGVHSIRILVLALVAVTTSTAVAAPPVPRGDAAYWDDYWQGLMSMRQEQWDKAAESFARAWKRDPADGRPLLASGVAHALAGDFKAARDDLDRARFLKSREPTLWQYAVDAMTGTSEGERGIPIPRSLQKPGEPTATFSSVPGHMIQGREDYTTAYASAVIYELAMPYRAACEAKTPLDSPALHAARVKVRRWFANRMLATGDFASRNLVEAKRLIQLDKLPAALELLEFARMVYPFDADMALLSGDIWLKAGRPATARWDFTIAATFETDLSGAYAGRAEAAAMMGDARTARADLKHAERYGALPAGLGQLVEKLLAANRVDVEPTALLAELDKAANDGANDDRLVPLASRLQRSAAERHLRYDEVYQDAIRGFEDAIRADKSAIAPRVELAQYLHDEADLRGEQVEPRRGLKPFRWQFTRAMELSRALHSVDEALRIDPKHVPALVTKAYVLSAMNRDTEAERLLDQATKIAGPSDAKAMQLLAMYRKSQISRMLSTDGALRSPRFESSTGYENRSDGVYRITRTTRYDPTAADLARADELERQARALMKETKLLMKAAIKVSRGTLDGLLLESAYEDWFGTRDQALKLIQQAVKENPKALKAHEVLIDYLLKFGQRDAAIRHEAVAWQLFQTTCAPLLRLTWLHILDNGWPALLKDLERARLLDPTDARATAYFAIAKREMRESKESIALLKVATALERARLELDDQGIGKQWPRPAEDLASAMQLHQDLAQALKSAGRADEALTHFITSGDLALRYPPDGVAGLMYGAMRPDDRAPAVPVAAPVNGATLASRAHLGAAKELQAVGRNADARKYLEAAAQNTRIHGSMTPMVSNGKGDSNFGGFAEGASATALIELAKDDIANQRFKEAFDRLQTASQAKPSNDERRLINELTLKILPQLNAANRQPDNGVQKRMAAILIDAAKEQIDRKEFRAASQTLNRAAQSRPNADEKQQIDALLRQIPRDMK